MVNITPLTNISEELKNLRRKHTIGVGTLRDEIVSYFQEQGITLRDKQQGFGYLTEKNGKKGEGWSTFFWIKSSLKEKSLVMAVLTNEYGQVSYRFYKYSSAGFEPELHEPYLFEAEDDSYEARRHSHKWMWIDAFEEILPSIIKAFKAEMKLVEKTV